MKQFATAFLALSLSGMLLLAGCSAAGSGGSSTSVSENPASGGTSLPEGPTAPDGDAGSRSEDGSVSQEGAGAQFTAEDESVKITISLDKPVYDADTLIETRVTITNTGRHTLAYVQGSGASICPDALKYTLGDLTALFYPLAVTMDYRVEILEPGQSLELTLGFAPYIANQENLMVGTDKDISFFRDSEDFSPAQSGPVTGSAVFTYKIIEEGAEQNEILSRFEDLEEQVLALDFETAIA